MVARPAPGVVVVPTWRVAVGATAEWLRLFVGGGLAHATARWQLWLGAGWVALAVATVVGIGAVRSVPATTVESAKADTVSAEIAPASESTEAPSATLDLAPLANAGMFRAPAVRRAPRQSAIVPDLGNELQLNGVVGGDDPRAIIYHKRTQQVHSVRVGQQFGEFEVIEIHPMKVILKWRDETIELSM